MIKAVIFDMDGVLLDTEKYYSKYWAVAGQMSGFALTHEHGCWLRSFAGKFSSQMTKLVFGEQFDYWKVRDLRKKMMEPMLEKLDIEAKPDAAEVLKALRAKGLMTAVATASDEKRTRALLDYVGLLEQFDRIICAEMVDNGKPMPDIYRMACQRLNLKPGECIAVEDSPNGVLAAYGAGCKTVMAVDLTEPDEILSLMLYRKVERLKELLDL